MDIDRYSFPDKHPPRTAHLRSPRRGPLGDIIRSLLADRSRQLWHGAALASVLVGTSAVLFLAVQGHRSLFVIPAWACIQLAVMKWGDIRRLKSVPGVTLLAMALLWTVGAAGATVWGHGEPTMSWTLAVFGWLLVAVYATRITERLFTIVSLGAYPHAAVAIWQGLWSQQRALGLAGDQNVTAGFLGVAVVYLAARRTVELDDLGGCFGDRRHGLPAFDRQWVAAGPDDLEIHYRLLTRFSQRYRWPSAETQVAAFTPDKDPLHPPPGSRRVHPEIEPLTVGVHAWAL